MIVDSVFEEKLLACMTKEPGFCDVACQHLEAELFDGPIHKNMAGIIIEFFRKYRTCITDVAMIRGAKALVTAKKISKEDLKAYFEKYAVLKKTPTTDWKFLLDELVAFIKNKMMRELIENSVKRYLPKNDFTTIEKQMRRISDITVTPENPDYDYFAEANIDERAKIRKEEALIRRTGISTGIKRMDEILHRNGWFEKELYIILAPPKRGKTMSLLWFANAAALQGYNVAYFSCEVSREICQARLDAMNSNIEFKHLPFKADDSARAVKAKVKAGKVGHLWIYEHPTKTLTVDQVENKVKKITGEHGPIHLVCVDYLDILKPSRRYEDKWVEQSGIAEDLRGLAGKYRIPVLTASQVNRQGSSKALINGSDVAGSFEKIMVADEIITLSATDEELKSGKLRIHFSDSRNSERSTIMIGTEYNMGRFYKEYIGTEL